MKNSKKICDVEYLQKNYLNYDVGIIGCASDISSGYERYFDADEVGDEKEARKEWKEFYENLVYLIAYCRIAGIDFDSWYFQRDVYKALHHLARSEKRRRRIERATRWWKRNG